MKIGKRSDATAICQRHLKTRWTGLARWRPGRKEEGGTVGGQGAASTRSAGVGVHAAAAVVAAAVLLQGVGADPAQLVQRVVGYGVV